MKQGHLALVFLTIYSICFILLFIEQERYDKVQGEKQIIEQALISAIQNAGEKYSAVIYESEETRKRILEHTFLESLYVAAGILEDKEKQEIIRMYLPMMVLAEEDGVFFFYMEEQTNGTVKELSHTWTNKIPYEAMEQYTDAQLKHVVALTIENTASEIISQHNYIASQYGLSYRFYVPDFLQNTSEKLNFPMLFVAFQGWPLNASGDIVYENCIDAGGYIQKVKLYTVTGPENPANPFSLYHESSCPLIKKGNYLSYEDNVNEKEAIKRFGAYPCKNCIN